MIKSQKLVININIPQNMARENTITYQMESGKSIVSSLIPAL